MKVRVDFGCRAVDGWCVSVSQEGTVRKRVKYKTHVLVRVDFTKMKHIYIFGVYSGWFLGALV